MTGRKAMHVLRSAADLAVTAIADLVRGAIPSTPEWVERARARLRHDMGIAKVLIHNQTGGLTTLFEAEPRVSPPPAAGSDRTRTASDDFCSVDDLVAGVVHEIRNPLTAIRLWMFSIQEAVEKDEELNRRCSLVGQEISRLERLSQSFLTYARLPQMRVRPLKIAVFLDEIMEVLGPYLESIPVRIRRYDAGYVPPAMADREQMEQVIINLLTNAAEALTDGGEIFISTDFECGGSDVPMVVIRIRDTGAGLSPEVRERVLETLTSSKHHGKGLGLYIAARITENHGGKLSVESTPDRGTTVSVRIPAVCGDMYGNHSGR